MESVRLREYERKTQMRANELELFKDSFVLVPYQVSGYIDVTNRGISNSPQRPQDFETFKRVWTGNDAVVINWKDSLYYTQNNQTPNKDLEVSYQLGKVILGRMEEESNDITIENDESFSQYKSQQSEGILRFRVDNLFDLDDNYQFYFWKIPEISGSTLYRVERLEKDYVGNKLVGYVISLKTLNQDISNTGRAKQQNVMPSAPGQGYLECIVEDNTWPQRIGEENFNKLVEGVDYYKFYDRYITADFQKTLNRPVYSVVIKQYGACVLNSVAFFGRPVERGDSFTKFRSPRLIFPMNLTNARTTDFYNTQQSEVNYYFGSLNPTLESYKDFQEAIRGVFNPINDYKYEGELEFNLSKLQATNDVTQSPDSAYYPNDLYGKVEDDPSGTKIRKPWQFALDRKVYSTTNNRGCAEQYTIYNDTRAIHDHLFDNYWLSKTMKTLPTTKKTSLAYGNSLASTLGSGNFGLFNIFKLTIIGMAWLLDEFGEPKHYQDFRGLVSAPLIDLNQASTQKQFVYMNIFESGAKSPSAIFFNNSTMNTTFQARLTDRFVDNKTSGLAVKTLSTLNIGQTTLEDGTTNIRTDGKEYLLSGGTELINGESGYIIDQVLICSLGKCDISIEFLDENNEVIWTGIYQSEGKWTDSFREIWTIKYTSVFGRENVFWTEPQPYPKVVEPIISPDTPKNYPTIELNYQLNNFAYLHPQNAGYDAYLKDISFSSGDKLFYGGDTQILKPTAYFGYNTPTIPDYFGYTKKTVATIGKEVSSFEDFVKHYGTVRFKLNFWSSWQNIWHTVALGPASAKYSDKSREKELITIDVEIPSNASQNTWYGANVNYNGESGFIYANSVGNLAKTDLRQDYDRVEFRFVEEDGEIKWDMRWRLTDRGKNAQVQQPNTSTMIFEKNPRIGKSGGSLWLVLENNIQIYTRQRT